MGGGFLRGIDQPCAIAGFIGYDPDRKATGIAHRLAEVRFMNSTSSDMAAWVQAICTIAAVVGAAWVAAREGRQARRLEARDREEALGRERHER